MTNYKHNDENTDWGSPDKCDIMSVLQIRKRQLREAVQISPGGTGNKWRGQGFNLDPWDSMKSRCLPFLLAACLPDLRMDIDIWVELCLVGEEGDDRGWGGWIASPTQWTWVGANSGREWRTGKPGVLQSTGSQSQTRLCKWTANAW